MQTSRIIKLKNIRTIPTSEARFDLFADGELQIVNDDQDGVNLTGRDVVRLYDFLHNAIIQDTFGLTPDGADSPIPAAYPGKFCKHGYNGLCEKCDAMQTPPLPRTGVPLILAQLAGSCEGY